MLLGYARVSKADDQDTAAQVNALKAAGCARVYEEKASGGRWDRPELHRLLDHLREGDAVVVWKLDRLSRSLKDLLHILEKIDAAAANFRSLTEAIDTSGPAGRMMMQMLGSFAEFERAMVRERTRAGLKAAREQGRKGGRRPKLLAHQRAEILAMLAAGRAGADIARIFRVHRATVSRIAAETRTISGAPRLTSWPLSSLIAWRLRSPETRIALKKLTLPQYQQGTEHTVSQPIETA